LYELSYANVVMYSSVLPSNEESKEPDFDSSKDANDPNNFNDDTDEIIVRA